MTKAKVAILVSGRGSNMAALVYASRQPDCPYEVVLVASNDPRAAGVRFAAAEGIATFAHSHRGLERAVFDAIIDEAIRASGAQFVALAGYMRILSPEFVTRWAGRMINIHPSLLPKYKGLHTHARAIAAGDSHGGCSVHEVTATLDDGPVLAQTRVAILPDDSEDSLSERVLIAEHQLYARALADFVRRDTSPEALQARIRALALAMPESDEVTSHGMPCYGISGGKKFAYFTWDHHHDGATAVIVKTSSPDEQAMLIEQDEAIFYKPAYFGASGWIGVRLDQGEVDWEMVEQKIAASWRLVAPRKLTKLLDAMDQF